MKSTIIASLFVLFSQVGYTQFPGVPNSIVYEVSFQFMEGCETGKGKCDPVTLIRKSLNDSVVIVFPSGGTSSFAGIYTMDEMKRGAGGGQPTPIRSDNKIAGQGKPVISLTGLPDGQYTAHIISCGLGGSFSINLVTAKN